MLEETKQLLQKTKHSKILEDHKRQKQRYYIKKYLRILMYITISITSLGILFFPIQSATIIGNWYNNFIGTLINIIK